MIQKVLQRLPAEPMTTDFHCHPLTADWVGGPEMMLRDLRDVRIQILTN